MCTLECCKSVNHSLNCTWGCTKRFVRWTIFQKRICRPYRFTFFLFLNHVKIHLELDLCLKTQEFPHSTTCTLTELIPIPLAVHATLHLLSRIDVSARMSHWTEHWPAERSPPAQRGLICRLQRGLWCPPAAAHTTSSSGNGMCALTCASWASVCCFRSCVERTQGMLPLRRVFPAYVFASTALHFLPLSSPW